MKFSFQRFYTAASSRSQRRSKEGGVVAMAAGGGSVGDANLRSYIDGNFVTLATEQTVEAHKNYAKGISMYGIPWEYDVERDAWTIKGNVIITKGLATYSTLKEDDVLSVFDGLPIDNKTLQWRETENGKILVAVGSGSGGGLDEDKLKDYLDKEKYVTESWVTGKNYALKSDLDTVSTKLNNFLEGSDTNSIIDKWSELEVFLSGLTETDNLAEILSGKANKSTTLAGYGITNAYTKTEVEENFLGINDIAVGAVTLKRTATSTSYLVAADNGFNVMNPWNTQTCWFGYGLPTGSAFATTNWRFGSSDGTGVASGNIHCGSVSIGGVKITYNSAKNAFVIPANVIIEGGLATYTKLSGFTNLDVMGGVVTDGTTIHINSAGQLEVIGSTGGGGSVSITGAASTIVSSNLAASRALISNSSGKVAVSAVTSTELGYLDGVTSAIQTQLNNKQATLVSGTNIKTINNQSILGSGNITISGGSGGGISLSDVEDYLGDNGYVTRSSAGALANVSGLTPNTNGMADSGVNIGAESLTYRSIYVHNLYPRKAYALRVYTSQSSTSSYVERLRVGSSGLVSINGTSDDTTLKLYVNGNAKATSFLQSSDRRLKDVDYEGDGIALANLKKVKVARWKWKDQRDSKHHIGGIADDIRDVLPEVVFDHDDGTLSMDYGKAGFSIAASLIAPVSRHEDRIKELEKNIEKMQKELNKLKKSA